MEDKDFEMYFRVVLCYHPTEYDPAGRDGLYVKEIVRVDEEQLGVQPTGTVDENI